MHCNVCPVTLQGPLWIEVDDRHTGIQCFCHLVHLNEYHTVAVCWISHFDLKPPTIQGFLYMKIYINYEYLQYARGND